MREEILVSLEPYLLGDRTSFMKDTFYYIGYRVFYFRIFGFGLHFKRMESGDSLLFSERYGYTKHWMIGKIKIKILTR